MVDCAPVVVGQRPAPLSVRLMHGEPAAVVIPVEGVLSAPVLEWATRGGVLVVSRPLEASGTDGDGRALWSVTLAAAEVDAMQKAAVVAVRAVETAPNRRVLLAGPVHWLYGWSGACETVTAPLRVVGLPGRGVQAIDDVDGDGVATITYSDGTTQDLPLPAGGPGGGVTATWVAQQITAHVADPTPHPAYDVAMPSLKLLFENAIEGTP